MSDYVENIYLRLPELFFKAGMTNVTLNGYLSTFLLCDRGHDLKEMRKHLRAKFDLWRKLEERNKECARIGGMSGEEIEDLFQRYSVYLGI